MKVLETIQGQCKVNNFLFSHPNPEDFVKSQWQRDDKCVLWLIWRWICAVFFLAGVTASLSQGWSDGKWFIYLTDWGFILIALTNCISALLSTIYYFTLKTYKHTTQFFWLLYHTNAVLAFFITLIYWSLVFPSKPGAINSYINWLSHFSNSLITLIDVFLCAHPIRLLHFIYPLAFGIIYDIFLVIYYVCDGTDFDGNPYVYSIMDFRKPRTALLYQFLCLVVIILLTLFLHILYMLRLCLYSKIRGESLQTSVEKV